MKLAPLATLGCSLLMAASTMAVGVTPSYDTFGNLSGATFGGSGNPTDPVAITTIRNAAGAPVLTLGLAAQQRYFNPAVGNNGAGTYFATPGQNNGLGSSSYQGATWNFDYYIDGIGANTAGYSFKLFVGQDTTNPTGYFDPLLVGDNQTTPNGGGQNSENLLFPAFGNLASFQLNPLSGFDPNANADYSFVLAAYDANNTELGRSAIVVRVGTGTATPDAGSTSLLLGSALAGLALVRRKIAA
ncbi:MAG: VPDSG-CTERM sorting domain-containing protein [Verrucomicrobiota bacterium]